MHTDGTVGANGCDRHYGKQAVIDHANSTDGIPQQKWTVGPKTSDDLVMEGSAKKMQLRPKQRRIQRWKGPQQTASQDGYHMTMPWLA